MSIGENSDFGPGYLEELSEYSNQDLRLGPEYARVEESFKVIQSFKEAIELLKGSDTSYHRSAKAVGSAWPEAYDAFISIDEALEELPEKMNSEKVMNSAFHNFKAGEGEVASRREELEDAIQEAKQIYKEAAAALTIEVKNAALRGQKTPLDYAEIVSSSKAFDDRAEELQSHVIRPEDPYHLAGRVLDQTDAS